MAHLGNSEHTLLELFARRVAETDDSNALWLKRGDAWQGISWRQIAADVRRTAAALVALGVNPGDRVIQVSENRYEWIVSDLAIHLTRGVHVAVHASLAAPQVAYQVVDSGAQLVLVSGAEQATKLAQAANQLPAGINVLSYDACDCTFREARIGRLEEFVSNSSETDRRLEDQARSVVRSHDLATILYTSGTTGEPKGVMLSHGNLASNALASLAAFGINPDELRLCWLPLSHIFARTADLYTWLACGCQLALARSRDTIIADCAEIHPTAINGVPYFFEKVYRYLNGQGKADEPGALQTLLGGRIRSCCSGGAPLPDTVAAFFERQGVLLVQGYGLTESSPVITTGTAERNRRGTVGTPISGVEVQIAEDGEVLTRGPHVMLGYWENPEATSQAIRDGWLHTGDLGQLEDGYLRITGRKKELIVTAGGKNVAPTFIEGLLTDEPLIAQAIVVGDGRSYLAALLVPDFQALNQELTARRLEVPAIPEQLCSNSDVECIYEERIRHRLEGVSHCEQVRRFKLLTRPLSVENGELTPTLKLRREVITTKFAAEIAAMYELPAPPVAATAARL